MQRNIIFAEMARRKVRFHPDEEWNTLRLWGLFMWGDISPLLKSGELKTHMNKLNHTIWVWPSKECWENDIKPLVEENTLEELTSKAGW